MHDDMCVYVPILIYIYIYLYYTVPVQCIIISPIYICIYVYLIFKIFQCSNSSVLRFHCPVRCRCVSTWGQSALPQDSHCFHAMLGAIWWTRSGIPGASDGILATFMEIKCLEYWIYWFWGYMKNFMLAVGLCPHSRKGLLTRVNMFVYWTPNPIWIVQGMGGSH